MKSNFYDPLTLRQQGQKLEVSGWLCWDSASEPTPLKLKVWITQVGQTVSGDSKGVTYARPANLAQLTRWTLELDNHSTIKSGLADARGEFEQVGGGGWRWGWDHDDLTVSST